MCVSCLCQYCVGALRSSFRAHAQLLAAGGLSSVKFAFPPDCISDVPRSLQLSFAHWLARIAKEGVLTMPRGIPTSPESSIVRRTERKFRLGRGKPVWEEEWRDLILVQISSMFGNHLLSCQAEVSVDSAYLGLIMESTKVGIMQC